MGKLITMIIGLGNHVILDTRHSIGMKVCNALATRYNSKWCYQQKYKAYTATFTWHDDEVILLKSKFPMNLNGCSVYRAVKDMNIELKNVILLHDDLCRAFGKISWKYGGSAGGHNGVRSVISSLASNDFRRLRIGIGRPESKRDVIEYVLQNFTEHELENLETVINRCICMLDIDISKTHTRDKSPCTFLKPLKPV
ncbi:peptidyl-tRNA hydrolase-like [Hydractinia symbiolongicarpus]|uniref:peptidyl-tRNA hydrolase-like n=1 Tax=Hydractinia symbiolongicarpus TaxID=13093 RepID=UPI00254E2798|nr:peptidyl-tRNA hydrolase-like [Hydractinia symbiolongicarpus]